MAYHNRNRGRYVPPEQRTVDTPEGPLVYQVTNGVRGPFMCAPWLDGRPCGPWEARRLLTELDHPDATLPFPGDEGWLDRLIETRPVHDPAMTLIEREERWQRHD